MMYAVMFFVALLGLGGYLIDKNADERGEARATAACTQVKNDELAQLNQDNEILNNRLIRIQRQKDDRVRGIENGYKRKLKENRAAHDLALDHYGNTIRVLLNEAQNSREDKDRRKREIITSFINGNPGTAGSNLSPETRRDIELLSIAADREAILLELCVDTYESQRESE